jgi:hypothetical protein
MTVNRMKIPLVVIALLVVIAGGGLAVVNFAFDQTKVRDRRPGLGGATLRPGVRRA